MLRKLIAKQRQSSVRRITLLSHLTAFLLLLLLTYRLLSNLNFLKWMRRQLPPKAAGQLRVSILVPARNEEATIANCVTSLLDQEYPNFEVIVLNDGSTDSTGAQLDALAATCPTLRVINTNDTLPTGWNGKSFACHRLAAQASGEWLLFTDADTQHTPHSVARGIDQALALDVDLLSAFPAQETITWSERIFVSFIIDFLPLVALDFRSIYHGKGSTSGANGQYLLIRADAYHRAGGHAAISKQTLDDFALAKHLRLGGYRIALTDGRELLRCRMYRSTPELWQGFSRSLMHGLEHASTTSRSAAWAMLFAWGYSALFVNPFGALLSGTFRWLAVLELFWMALLRIIVSRHLRRSLLEVLTTPVAAWGVMALGMATLYQRWRGQKVNWRGRDVTG
jgi:chlorobactene glucosyltransferase